jgi:hypothetical protein
MPYVPALKEETPGHGHGGSTLHSWTLVRDILLEEQRVNQSHGNIRRLGSGLGFGEGEKLPLPGRVSRLALFSFVQKQAPLASLSPSDGAAVRALLSCTDGEITRLFHSINDKHPGNKSDFLFAQTGSGGGIGGGRDRAMSYATDVTNDNNSRNGPGDSVSAATLTAIQDTISLPALLELVGCPWDEGLLVSSFGCEFDLPAAPSSVEGDVSASAFGPYVMRTD